MPALDIFSQIGKANKEQQEQQIKSLKQILEPKIKELKEIKARAVEYGFYRQNKNINKNVKWSKILGASYDIINYNQLKEDKEKEKIFIQDMTKAYELTTFILSELGYIHSITTTITDIGNDYSYYRFPNIEIKAEYLILNKEASKKGNNFGLRLDPKKIKEDLKDSMIVTEATQALSQHFKNFIQPFLEYEQHARTTTQWKPNKGVLGETFERHLQLVQHLNISDLRNNSLQHFGSVGRRWVLYKLSSGSDPFYTGPDTELAQVKNANASLVSNVQTIIYTLEGVLSIIQGADLDNYTKKQDIESIFKQADKKINLSEKIYQDLLNKSPYILKDILESALKEGIVQIVITSKQDKHIKKQVYSLQNKDLSLDIRIQN